MNTGISYLDIIILISLVIFIFIGYKRGFTEEFLKITGTIIAFFVAIRFMSNLSLTIIKSTGLSPTFAMILSFTIIFLGIIVIFRVIRQKTRNSINISMVLGNMDKFVGGLLGLFKGTIIVSILTILLSLVTLSPELQREITKSKLYDPMRHVAPQVYDLLKHFIPRSNPFATEFEESFSGVSKYKVGKKTQEAILFHQKK